jgi:hypothetical protein
VVFPPSPVEISADARGDNAIKEMRTGGKTPKEHEERGKKIHSYMYK